MRRRLPDRACALVVVLALLVGTAFPGGGTSAGCGACAPGCPMHARRVGCHQAKGMSCHKAPSPGLRAACSHREDAAPGAARPLRGIMPLRTAPEARGVAHGTAPRPLVFASRPLPEPPTGPPRFLAA